MITIYFIVTSQTQQKNIQVPKYLLRHEKRNYVIKAATFQGPVIQN